MASSPSARQAPGGFIPPPFTSLPSPAPSTASSRTAALLPLPRSKPLAPGSKKEDYARDYVSRRLLHISRRFVKKHGIPDPADEVTGYESVDECCHDLEDVVDVLWYSGTPSLQVPYLLNVALAFNDYLPSFTPSPRPTFGLLRKLDHCFASLLVGHDIKTQAPLAGFTSTAGNGGFRQRFTKTDMVRCKSLADETRMIVAMVMSGEADVVDYADDDDENDAEEARKRPVCGNTPVALGHVGSPLHRQLGNEAIKVEEVEAAGDTDNGAETQQIHGYLKRKADDISHDSGLENHVKVEEDDAASIVDLDEITTLEEPSAAEQKTHGSEPNGTQFHWALDEDDESDGHEQPNATVSAEPHARALRKTPLSPPPLAGLGEDDTGTENVEDDEDEDPEEDEDEELVMNVGKVYEKTLTQLGIELGMSIVDG
ncbi:hypothetical protein F5Y18DRAFT_147100 [Xylariaceae sp. FL1019]|nr:hypothetical protein F5Y18DRAFT_147100 [Xylariaceae sp. FL1019]